MSMRAIVAFVIALGLLLPVVSHAEEMTLGRVTTQRLNMRSVPATSGAVLAELPMGMKVVLFSRRVGDWREIGVLIDNQTKTGWVREKFIEQLSSSPLKLPPASPSPSATPRSTYRAPLSIRDTDLNCRENIIGGGLSGCDYTIRVEYNGDADVEGAFSVDCDVEARMEQRDDLFPSRKTFDGYATLHVNSGYGSTTVDVTLTPGISIEPIVRVTVTDTSCRYNR
ncbi:SH3 domain-containing protein [Neorhizobium galegae]|uniref:SH3 domain-containing protein n=2 Tax=Neorhizobium galegae TaxID=399 RepID=UPI0006274ECE|nr:SH3 domain-containing protein [Neorhizobium galegae]KAA9388712.1 SH3 domain-containing protein [Neorhizobium galegae]KAB1116432.1 SH3 domain-containing protein [Neorhizobium galegae]MCM2498085.1 SH3 domain-containing protein [Neorhizobium galegae]MCQ1797736.1 SH3 domain-containing protein [Neorhizobium galegae]